MTNHCFTLALCLLALTAPSQAQLLGKGTLPIDSIQPLSHITDSLQRQISKQQQVFAPQQVTGVDALLDEIPDANERVRDIAAIEIRDKSAQPVLSEITVQHGWRALKQEWLLLLKADQVPQLRSLPVTVVSETNLPQLQMFTVRIRTEERYDDLSTLTDLLAPLGAEILTRHHIYDIQSAEPTPAESGDKAPTTDHPAKVSLGIIDTAFDHQHLGLLGADIHSKSFVRPNMAEPMAHATAVLGRLVGEGKSFAPMLSGTTVYSASVFYQKDAYSQSAPTIALLQALEWMLAKRVKVINMSLAGPPNALLEKALQRVQSQGIAVVAASGNAGPASRPLFPAAYASVIAVSAVDKNQRIYRWANRGKHIDFVAHGVNVTTLRVGGGEGTESGTSMAAPVISAALALRMQAQSLDDSIASLRKDTQDLGDPGRDVIFGDGFVALPD
jgi:minor extracellular protease Epr